jgi:hypothetical protein
MRALGSLVVAWAVLAGASAARAEADEVAEAAGRALAAPALSAALREAKVSLASGLKASEKEGRAISGKYELEDGKLQLSVYTMKGDKFFEVIVDHQTGRVVKTEAITGGDDLAAAKKQAEAMGRSKRRLSEVVAKVAKANAGYTPVSVEAEIEDGAARADVALLRGTESKQVAEKL